jgi:ribulose-phosphate 3-epimerase
MSQVAICPTVTAFNNHQYRAQMERIEPFAKRVHIDLMDGEFAPTKSPGLDQVWWPDNMIADIHLMYQRPLEELERLINLQPDLVVIHYEAQVDHLKFAVQLQDQGIKAGLALLPNTTAEDVGDLLPNFDHVLVFSGDLGYHGGHADLRLLDKVSQLREQFPPLEISWDGGINEQNANALHEAGVQVLNVGGFIQNADDPDLHYRNLLKIISN